MALEIKFKVLGYLYVGARQTHSTSLKSDQPFIHLANELIMIDRCRENNSAYQMTVGEKQLYIE